jgi:hypothetical protein
MSGSINDEWVQRELARQGIDPNGNPLEGDQDAARDEPGDLPERDESGHGDMYAAMPQNIVDDPEANLRFQANEAERRAERERTGDDGQSVREAKREQRRAEYEERQRQRNYEAGGKRAERQAELDGADQPEPQGGGGGPTARVVSEDEIQRLLSGQGQNQMGGATDLPQIAQEVVQLLRDMNTKLDQLGTIG